jgi:HSP20 family protein
MNDTKPQAPASIAKKAAVPPAPPLPSREDGVWQPLTVFRDEMDRFFENFWRSFGIAPTRMMRQIEAEPQPLWRPFSSIGLRPPAIDVVESEKEWRVTAELPGMTAKDVDVTLSDEVLTVKGEKKEHREEKAENYRISERRFGAFQRSFQLPRGVDPAKIDAKFEKGVLTISLPKAADAEQRAKTIEVKEAP